MRLQRFEKIKSARLRNLGALATLPNFMGTAIGYKRKGGERTRKSSLIIYVRKKLPEELLGGEEVFPSTICFERSRITTDVFALGDIEYQFGPPPWFCRDRIDNQGTVACLCKKISSGELFALSCAHCLEGEDHDISTPNRISLWDPSLFDYVPVGSSGICVDTNGYDDVGFSDWGVFSIENDELASHIRRTKAMRLGSILHETDVTATTSHGVIFGSIDHLNIQFPGLVADLAIIINRGATFPGDSGLLWRDMEGRAIAIHAIGERKREGSSISLCMSAERISSELASRGMIMLDV